MAMAMAVTISLTFHNRHRLPPPLLSPFPSPPKPIATSSPNLLADIDRQGHRSRGDRVFRCLVQAQDRTIPVEDPGDRRPFDLNLAVVLAGFAFESYTSPPSDVGKREVDGGGCQTVFLSEKFLREIYDGQLLIKLKKGVDLPAMDPWGTSDPYVIIQLYSQVVKSTTKWATKEPMWNEDISLYIDRDTPNFLQVAVWDANLVTPHKRMGNAGIDLTSLCDGNLHEVVIDLEGIGGGGKIYLEVKYKGFDEMDKETQWWGIPFLSDLIPQSNLGSALKRLLGIESVNAREFAEFAFGQLSSFNLNPEKNILSLGTPITEGDASVDGFLASGTVGSSADERQPNDGQVALDSSIEKNEKILASENDDGWLNSQGLKEEFQDSDGYFWKSLAGSINQTVSQKLGFPLPSPDLAGWDVYSLLRKSGMLSQRNAEEEYIQSGLAAPEISTSMTTYDSSEIPSPSNRTHPTFDITKATHEILSQTEAVLGAMMVLTTMFTQQKKDLPSIEENSDKNNAPNNSDAINILNETANYPPEDRETEKVIGKDTRDLFSSAESAMEAWAMLATSLGRTSFIKSEFEKICFLDNDSTDTQVAIWRDFSRKRLVVAFRGTEQARWKDLRTDLMLVPSGLNPERLGNDFREEVQVHSGFLSAYDSVRNRIMALVSSSIGVHDNDAGDDFVNIERWHIYVTGHSLGGALATLLALELSSSRLAKHNVISVSMYNFGSPRVGNKRFAEVYNQKVKDSWRIVNHRDIIPTVPRLMGYCHVAQPVYLAIGDLENALMNVKLSEDGYRGDIIGEYTPDDLVNEFMKGEKELIEKILEAEINLFRSIRDGSALMQHMEDFYYIALLESVKSNYKTPRASDVRN